MSVFREAVFENCSDLFFALKPAERTPVPELDIIALTKRARTPDAVYDCLSDWQKGFDIEQLPYEHGIPLAAITRYVANGQLLARLATQKGHSRSNSTARRETAREIILPSRPNDRWLRQETSAIKDLFHVHYRLHRDRIEWTVLYFLSNTTTTEPYVSFADPIALRQFLTTCELAIDSRCWRVECTRNPDDSESAIRQYWKLDSRYATEIIPSPGGVRGYRARLYYRHANEARLVAQFNETTNCRWKDPIMRNNRKETFRSEISRYSASTLRYLFRMLAIMMFETESLRAAIASRLGASSASDVKGILDRSESVADSMHGSSAQ